MDKLCRIRDLQRAVHQFEANLERQYGICLNEGMTLCSLSKAGRLSCGELSDLLGLTPSNMSKVLRSVEEKEFVRRELGTADKRQMYFSLTDRGRQLLASIDCGKIDSYIFSSQANADIMRIHNRNGNIWRRIYEIIFTANERSLLRFCLDEQGEPDFVWLRDEVRDPHIIDAMQQGILDFAHDYTQIERRQGVDLVIAARDAYRPLFRILHETDYNLRLFQEFEVCFIAGNVSRQRAEMFKDVVMKGGK